MYETLKAVNLGEVSQEYYGRQLYCGALCCHHMLTFHHIVGQS
jgi:hypothetical protein